MTLIYQIIIKSPCIPVYFDPFFIVTPGTPLCKFVYWETLHPS